MKDNSVNKKVTKIQEKNINGNYGRIYVQEKEKNKPNYSPYNNNQNNIKPYNKVKNSQKENKRYANSVDKNAIKNNKKKEEEKNNRLRRKSIDRGGDYNNIQVTHIIYSSRDIDFHITDPLVISNEETRKKYRGSVDKNNRNGKNGSVKVTCTSSCDNIKIIPKEKKKNAPKIEILSHRENPHLKKNNNQGKSIGNSYSMMSKQKNSGQIRRNERKIK